jgi:membrane dipeptidase
MTTSIVWDQHGCLPLRPDASAVDQLELYVNSGVTFVSINVGMDSTPPVDVIKVLAAFRHGINARPERFLLARAVSDVLAARAEGKLAVAFDLEGTEPLDGALEMVEMFYELGVRTMLMAYNTGNRAGGGCHDEDDRGLTAFGRAVVHEMNRVGMVVDATHCSRRTTFDLFETSTAPVIFSHSVPAGIKQHPRNVADDQMLACASTGGVIGVNGVGIFLGDDEATTDALVKAIDYVVQLVGAEHVGLGLDYVFDREELRSFVASKTTFPEGFGYRDTGELTFVSPSQISEVRVRLEELGYPARSIDAVLGGNFLRIASQVWGH